ncbi:MAG: restriction endonuclease subunit S, partial [Methylococcaceae bacterium]
MSEFLGKICRFEYGKSLPDKDRVPGAVLVYGSNGIIGTHSESYTFGETIVIGRKGSIGEINLVSDSCWPIDTTYYIDRTCTDCDLLWLSFVLRSLKLEVLNKGTGVPGLNREDAYKQRIQIPFSIEEQRQIAEKLKAQFAEVETARKALELQQQEIVNLANTLIRESIEQSVGAGHAR